MKYPYSAAALPRTGDVLRCSFASGGEIRRVVCVGLQFLRSGAPGFAAGYFFV
jgi:hypothetical protein